MNNNGGAAPGVVAPALVALEVADAFVTAAAENPGRVAIRDSGVDLTYAEVADRVRDLAGRLGVDPGVVGVSLPRSADAIVALLAVLAAGGTYCPVDPAFPVQRRTELMDRSGCRRLIDGDGVHVLAEPRDDEFPAWSVGQPAYVLFTSGSTGGPKPVMTSRAAIATVAAALVRLFAVSPGDRVLQFASLNWDTCFEEILPALTCGAALVIDQQSHSGSVAALLRLVAQDEVTVLNLPTAYWHVLVAHLSESGHRLPAGVRLVVIGGEAVSPVRLAEWHALGMPDVRLLNTYGCTETTLITHAAELTTATATVPIGTPLPHVVEHVSDDGELLIAGPAVALGYLGLPEETEQRFRIDDFGAGPMRFFHTGDRVVRRSDGGLQHRGRLDGELKVRGVRVDPAEVEFEIGRHPGVVAVAVAGVTVADHTTLVAYVVPSPRADADTLGAEVLALLRERVPRHLVPNRIAVVPALVHTVSGKIDRAGSHRLHAATGPAPQSLSMSVDDLSAVFCRVLEVEHVTAESDFFDAGGDSLLATRVLSVIARESGIELSFDDFARASSPTALAQLISAS